MEGSRAGQADGAFSGNASEKNPVGGCVYPVQQESIPGAFIRGRPGGGGIDDCPFKGRMEEGRRPGKGGVFDWRSGRSRQEFF